MTEAGRDRLHVRVANLDCENEAAAIQRAMSRANGVHDVEVRSTSATVTIAFDPAIVTHEALERQLAEAGFPPVKRTEPSGATPPWRTAKVLASLASGGLLGAGWAIERIAGSEVVALVCYVAAMLVGGYLFAREALEDLVHEREVGIELLMTIAAIAASVLGAPEEGAMLVFLYSISEAAEGYTAEKTRSAVKALMKLAPATATVRRDGQELDVPAEHLRVHDVFIVRPGGSFATDGVIVAGSSAVDESPITGESVPVEKSPGDAVLAGTINRAGALEVRVTKVFAENTLARIIGLVEEAQERKGRSQRFIERFGRWYSPIVLAGCALVAVLPAAFGLSSWQASARLGTILLVAAAPCALVISIPITLVAALGMGARRGVLIKGGIHVEELARIRVVALDKTGTLTKGEPELTDVRLAPDSPLAHPDHFLAMVAAVERWSEHPLARAIVAGAARKGLRVPESSSFQALVGAGAMARVGDRVVHVGSPGYFADVLKLELGPLGEELEALERDGKTIVVVGTAGAVWGAVALRDELRPDAAEVIRALRDLGVVKVVMLTGDNERAARAIAAQVGIDEVFAALKPEDKVRHVRALALEHGHLLMVGDGVNDAPALAEATVGVAMGAAGTDVALETADVALMADDLNRLVDALALGRRTRRIVHQNLALSVLVILAMVGGAIAGALSLPMVVLAHELSELAVIGNGLRVLRWDVPATSRGRAPG